MLDYLEQLRKKPLYYRKRVAALTTTVITAVIIVVWFSTFNFERVENVLDSKAMAEELKPLQHIKASVADFYSSVQQMGAMFFESATSSFSDK